MECNTWEEYGLLFASGELDVSEKKSFEQHLKECDTCARENEAYRSEQKCFFTPEILEAAPTPECDAEIIRVCSDGRRKVSGLHPMPIFIRKSVVSLALFVIGFVGVGYLTIKNSNQNQGGAVGSIAKESSIATETIAGTGLSDGVVPKDSTTDSSSQKDVNYSKTRGNLGLNGVYPVELQNK